MGPQEVQGQPNYCEGGRAASRGWTYSRVRDMQQTDPGLQHCLPAPDCASLKSQCSAPLWPPSRTFSPFLRAPLRPPRILEDTGNGPKTLVLTPSNQSASLHSQAAAEPKGPVQPPWCPSPSKAYRAEVHSSKTHEKSLLMSNPSPFCSLYLIKPPSPPIQPDPPWEAQSPRAVGVCAGFSRTLVSF